MWNLNRHSDFYQQLVFLRVNLVTERFKYNHCCVVTYGRRIRNRSTANRCGTCQRAPSGPTGDIGQKRYA